MSKCLSELECSILFRLKRGPLCPMNKREKRALSEMENLGWVRRKDFVFFELVPDFKIEFSRGPQ